MTISIILLTLFSVIITYIFYNIFKWQYKYNKINKTLPLYKIGDYLRVKESGDDPFGDKYYHVKIIDIKQNHKGEYYVKTRNIYSWGAGVESSNTAYLIYDMFDTKNIINDLPENSNL